MIRKFINRSEELNTLNSEWQKDEFSLVILYGRRRIGKTRLLTEFMKDKKSIYYIAIESTYNLICNEFSDVVKELIGLPVKGDIIEIIESITEFTNEKILIVFDEFQYIVESDKSFISRLQRSIDTKLRQKNLMIILCGSAVSFFDKELLGYKSPIFGRRTSSIKLNRLNFKFLKFFLPDYSFEDLVRTFGIVGGIPAYLEKFNSKMPFEKNLENIITPGNYMYDEAINFLRQELREPRTYLSILSAISEGYTRVHEVTSKLRIDPRNIRKYIDKLEMLGVIKKEYPLKGKKYILRFNDQYFRFWFSYIRKLRNTLENGMISEGVSYILSNYNHYLGETFENVVKDLLYDLYKLNFIETKPLEFGRWWHKDSEIDFVIKDNTSTTFLEIKWSDMTKKDIERELEKLIEKSKKTQLQSYENYYGIICKQIKDNEAFLKINEHSFGLNLSASFEMLKE